MIEMIFEGGYVYYMTEHEYYLLLGLTGLGVGLVITVCATLETLLVRKILNHHKRRA